MQLFIKIAISFIIVMSLVGQSMAASVMAYKMMSMTMSSSMSMTSEHHQDNATMTHVTDNSSDMSMADECCQYECECKYCVTVSLAMLDDLATNIQLAAIADKIRLAPLSINQAPIFSSFKPPIV